MGLFLGDVLIFLAGPSVLQDVDEDLMVDLEGLNFCGQLLNATGDNEKEFQDLLDVIRGSGSLL